MAACAATIGTFTGLFETIAWFEPPRWVFVSFSEWSSLIGILFLICAMLMQQMVLRGAGVEPGYWGWATAGGLILGSMASVLVVMIAYVTFGSLFRSHWGDTIGVMLALFTIGAVVGGMQALQIMPKPAHRILWMIASGTAVLAATMTVSFVGYRGFVPFRPTTYYTLWGLVYGAITGGCLAWLSNHPDRYCALGQRSLIRTALQKKLAWNGLPERP